MSSPGSPSFLRHFQSISTITNTSNSILSSSPSTSSTITSSSPSSSNNTSVLLSTSSHGSHGSSSHHGVCGYDTEGSTDKILVTFYDDYGVWKFLEEPLKAQISSGLRSIVWKTKNGVVKTLEDIQLVLMPSEDKLFQYPLGIPLNWYLKPFVSLFLVQCEDNEHYKHQLKNRIKSWIQSMQEKQQEWMIVHVSLGRSNRSELAAMLYRTTVYDKIRSDFNTRQSRCFQIRIMDDPKNDAQLWEEFFVRFKECIIASFEQCITSYEEEIRKVDAKRMLPGWNYCNFFLLKEGLAFTYERVNLPKEALKQYYELEALFMESGTGKKLDNFGGTDPGDDQVAVLDTRKKAYRQLIHQNRITEFDFRHYLLARQLKLLIGLGRPVKIAKTAILHIQKLSKDLDRNKDLLPKYFRECCIYSACLNIITMCETLNVQEPKSKQELCFLLGDLFYNARCRLDALGELHGVLDNELLNQQKSSFSGSDEGSSESTGANSQTMTKQSQKVITIPELQLALQSQAEYDKLYLDITLKAANYYKESMRYRSVVRLNGEIASLYYKRGLYHKAESLLKSLCTMYFTEGWFQLVYPLRLQLAECQRKLKHESEYLSSCLSLLSPQLQTEMKADERLFFTTEFLTVAKELLQASIVKDLQPLMHAIIKSNKSRYCLGSTIVIQCHLHSSFPQSIPADTIHLKLNGSGKDILLHMSSVMIKPGNTLLEFTKEAMDVGEYYLDKLSIDVGKLTLIQPLRTDDKVGISVGPSLPTAKLQLVKPECLIWEKNQFIHLVLLTNEDQITNATLSICASSHITLPNHQTRMFITTATEKSDLLCDLIDGTLKLHALPKEATIEIDIVLEAFPNSTQPCNVLFICNYEKNTQEHFTIQTKCDLQFTYPFKMYHYISTFDTCLFLQVILESKLPNPLCLLHSQIVGSNGEIYLPGDNNANSELQSGQRMSVVFQIAYTKWNLDQDDSAKFTLLTDYTINYQNDIFSKSVLLPEKYQYGYEVSTAIPQVMFNIEGSCVPSYIRKNLPVIGAFVPYLFTLWLSEQQSSNVELQLEILYDEQLWLITGPRKASITLKVGEKAKVWYKLLPLCAGFLPLPEVRVCGVAAQKVLFVQHQRQIFVHNQRSLQTLEYKRV